MKIVSYLIDEGKYFRTKSIFKRKSSVSHWDKKKKLSKSRRLSILVWPLKLSGANKLCTKVGGPLRTMATLTLWVVYKLKNGAVKNNFECI